MKELRGDRWCPFWRSDNGGICKGWPEISEHPCPANEDGSGCPLYSDIATPYFRKRKEANSDL